MNMESITWNRARELRSEQSSRCFLKQAVLEDLESKWSFV